MTQKTSDDVTIKDYVGALIKNLEDKIDAQSKFTAQHFQLNEIAIKKAEDSMTARLEGMNEFREQLKEERGSLATKEHLESMTASFDARLKTIENANSFAAGKNWIIMSLFAAIPTVLALIALFIK
jgi:DNA repair exonuclease SbcCD ATPase subunit